MSACPLVAHQCPRQARSDGRPEATATGGQDRWSKLKTIGKSGICRPMTEARSLIGSVRVAIGSHRKGFTGAATEPTAARACAISGARARCSVQRKRRRSGHLILLKSLPKRPVGMPGYPRFLALATLATFLHNTVQPLAKFRVRTNPERPLAKKLVGLEKLAAPGSENLGCLR